MLLTHATEFYPYYRSRHAKFIDIKNSVFLSILKKLIENLIHLLC